MKLIATSLPTTFEEFQLMLEAAFASGQALGKALAKADQPAREWVGLTDEEVESLQRLAIDPVDANGWGVLNRERFARLVEARLKERNT